MAQSKEFVDASHALNYLSHALALLESKNASLQGAVDGLCNENAKLRELAKGLYEFAYEEYARAAKAGFADDLRDLGVEVDE